MYLNPKAQSSSIGHHTEFGLTGNLTAADAVIIRDALWKAYGTAQTQDEKDRCKVLHSYMAQQITKLFEIMPEFIPAAVITALHESKGGKIHAIKAYRQMTNTGLKEAKDMIEKFWWANPWISQEHYMLWLDTPADIPESVVVKAMQTNKELQF